MIHPCNTCGREWCKCHQNPRYRYPEGCPDDYRPEAI